MDELDVTSIQSRRSLPSDVWEAVAWLASDAARYVTGVALPIDAGNVVKKG